MEYVLLIHKLDINHFFIIGFENENITNYKYYSTNALLLAAHKNHN